MQENLLNLQKPWTLQQYHFLYSLIKSSENLCLCWEKFIIGKEYQISNLYEIKKEITSVHSNNILTKRSRDNKTIYNFSDSEESDFEEVISVEKKKKNELLFTESYSVKKISKGNFRYRFFQDNEFTSWQLIEGTEQFLINWQNNKVDLLEINLNDFDSNHSQNIQVL